MNRLLSVICTLLALGVIVAGGLVMARAEQLNDAAVQPVLATTPSPQSTPEEMIASQSESPTPRPSAFCGSIGIYLRSVPSSMQMLAWTSHQIVTGRVVGQSKPFWSEPMMSGPGVEEHIGGSARTILTDYTIRVEDRLRATLESGVPPAGESPGALSVVPLSVAPLAEP